MIVRCRYDEAVTAAAQGDVRLALQLFRAATAVAVEQQDKQLETMAATAVGLLMTGNSQDLQQEEEGWTFLQRSVLQISSNLCLYANDCLDTITHPKELCSIAAFAMACLLGLLSRALASHYCHASLLKSV